MRIIYIDEIFVRNAAADWFLILITARLAGLSPWRKAYLFAGAAGGLYAAAVYVPGWEFLSAPPVRCAAGIALALIAFGREEHLARLTILFFAVCCGFAGCVLALDLFGIPGGTGAVFASVLIAGGMASAFCAAARRHVSGRMLRVRVCVAGKVTNLTALWDSGNALRDAGQPVLVIAPGCLDSILAPEIRPLFSPVRLRSPPDLPEPMMKRCPELRPRLLPYHTVGVPSGLLLTIASEWVEINGVKFPNLRLALSPTPLGNGIQALWGGNPGKASRETDSVPRGGNSVSRETDSVSRDGNSVKASRGSNSD